MGEMFLGDVIVLVYLVFRNKWFVLGIVILDNEIKGVFVYEWIYRYLGNIIEVFIYIMMYIMYVFFREVY